MQNIEHDLQIYIAYLIRYPNVYRDNKGKPRFLYIYL